MKNLALLSVLLVLTGVSKALSSDAQPTQKTSAWEHWKQYSEGLKKGFKSYTLLSAKYKTNETSIDISQGSVDPKDNEETWIGKITKDNLQGTVYTRHESEYGWDLVTPQTVYRNGKQTVKTITDAFDANNNQLQVATSSIEDDRIVTPIKVSEDCKPYKNPNSENLELRCPNKIVYILSGVGQIQHNGADITGQLENDWSEDHWTETHLQRLWGKNWREHNLKKNRDVILNDHRHYFDLGNVS